MTGRPESADYAAGYADGQVTGYADGVRDAAAWTGDRAARLLSLPAAELPTAIRQLHRDASARWAQWSDRRNWPSVKALVAKSRRANRKEKTHAAS